MKMRYSREIIFSALKGTSQEEMEKVVGLKKITQLYMNKSEELPMKMELMLHVLAELEVLGKNFISDLASFSDPLAMLLNEDQD